MNEKVSSAGWAIYFEEHFAQKIPPIQTELRMYNCISKNILTNEEYLTILDDAYNTYHTITLDDMKSYVVSGHITVDDYKNITGIDYTE